MAFGRSGTNKRPARKGLGFSRRKDNRYVVKKNKERLVKLAQILEVTIGSRKRASGVDYSEPHVKRLRVQRDLDGEEEHHV